MLVNVEKYDGSVPVTSLLAIRKCLCLTRTDPTHAVTSAQTRQCIAAVATSHVPKWSCAQSTEGLWQGARQMVVVDVESPARHSAHTSRITTDTTSTVGGQRAVATCITLRHRDAASKHSLKVRQQPHRRRDAAIEIIPTEAEEPAKHSVQHDGVTHTHC
jgi:hypothetical protein